jgi:hypothetical protein
MAGIARIANASCDKIGNSRSTTFVWRNRYNPILHAWSIQISHPLPPIPATAQSAGQQLPNESEIGCVISYNTKRHFISAVQIQG